jgi:hypothetical protein
MRETTRKQPTHLIFVAQVVLERIIPFCQPCPTPISTATRNRIRVSSPTWKQGAKRGTTVTSTVAKRRFCAPTAPSSPKQYSCVTGGLTSDANSARLYMQLTAGSMGHQGRTLHDHTDSSPKNFYRTYSSEWVHSRRSAALAYTLMYVGKNHMRLTVKKRLFH